ncbi:MAG: glycosyltransferase family 4 protein [Phycisphaerales bacterium]
MLPELENRLPGIKVLFIGDGWRRKHLEQRIAVAGLGEVIHMTGYISHDEVREILPAADVKVLPSYQEGQSRTLIEALLCGCGIVAYDVGGIPSICIDGETGKLVPVGNKQALADAIVWMIEHPDKCRAMTERGRQLVREKFSAEYMTRELEKLYQCLLMDKK